MSETVLHFAFAEWHQRRLSDNIMDEEKLQQAIAQLVNFEHALPDGDIKDSHIDLYNTTLGEIQLLSGCDLSGFSIPPTELKRKEYHYPRTRMIGHQGGSPARTEYSSECYFDRATFLIKLRGAIGFLNSSPQRASRRSIGYV